MTRIIFIFIGCNNITMMERVRLLYRAEPYKIFFIIGGLCSILGVGQWISFYFGFSSEYPIKAHSMLMILGFLFSFVTGFLMTAVPRMTGTALAFMSEKVFASSLLFIFMSMNFFGFFEFAHLISTVLFIFLIVYFSKRKMQMRGRELPTGFIFIPFGLACGLFGSAFLYFESRGITSLSGVGRLLLYEGFVLNLIIGLGSRLIPMLTRKTNALSPAEQNHLSHRIYFMQAFLINGSFFIEEFLSKEFGIFIRCLVMFYILWKNFHFFKPMNEFTKLGFGIMLASVSFPLSYMFTLLFPENRIHIIHILYIMGFATLTFLVSIRVSLAHGGASLDLERTSNSILLIVATFFLATVARVLGAVFGGNNIIGWYAIAGIIFLLGLLLWINFLKSTLFERQNETEKC